MTITARGGTKTFFAEYTTDSNAQPIAKTINGGSVLAPTTPSLADGSGLIFTGNSTTTLIGSVNIAGPTGVNEEPAEIRISENQVFALAENATLRITGKVNFIVESRATLDICTNAVIECVTASTKATDAINVTLDGGTLRTQSPTTCFNVAAEGTGTFTAINGGTLDCQNHGGVIFGGRGSRNGFTDPMDSTATIAGVTAARTADSNLTLLRIDATCECSGPQTAIATSPSFNFWQNEVVNDVETSMEFNCGNFTVNNQFTCSDTTNGAPYLVNPDGAAQQVLATTPQAASQRLGGTNFLNTTPDNGRQGVLTDGAVANLPADTTTGSLVPASTNAAGKSRPEYIATKDVNTDTFYTLSNGDGTTTTSNIRPDYS